MKKHLLLLTISVLFCQSAFTQFCNRGLAPNSGFRGQTLTTSITNSQLYFGNGSAPCNPSDVYLYNSSAGFTINASTLSIFNDSVRVSWTIPPHAPSGGYDLYINEYLYDTQFGSCIVGPLNCYTPQAFGIDASLITGSVFYDSNQDTIFNSNDFLLPNQRLLILPANITTFTDQSGYFNFWADTGTHTIILIENPALPALSSDTLVVHVGSSNVSNIDFAVYPDSIYFDTQVYLSGRPRCNTNQNYQLSYTNKAVIPSNLLIKVYHTGNAPYVSASMIPDSANGDTIYFSVSAFTYGWNYLSVVFSIPAAGSLISIGAIVETYDLNSNLVELDTLILNQTVLCSFDPNDKAVQPAGEYAQHYTLFGSELHYNIRFQNTGNDTAYTVRIRDTLDANLDFNTFELISYSHPMIVEMHPNGVIDFHFYNIMLPDSNIDEPGSHGFINYTIDHKQGLPENTVVNNKAYIYFDLNAPVITNETENTLVTVIPVGIKELYSDNLIAIYPNPFSEKVVVVNKEVAYSSQRLVITDMQGGQIMQRSYTGTGTEIDVRHLSSGIYLFKVQAVDGTPLYIGKLIKQ